MRGSVSVAVRLLFAQTLQVWNRSKCGQVQESCYVVRRFEGIIQILLEECQAKTEDHAYQRSKGQIEPFPRTHGPLWNLCRIDNADISSFQTGGDACLLLALE